MNPLDLECMWYATSFYDILKKFPKETIQKIAKECGELLKQFPTSDIIERKFKIKSIDCDMEMTGLQVVSLLSVCTDLLQGDTFDKDTNLNKWLIEARKLSEHYH